MSYDYTNQGYNTADISYDQYGRPYYTHMHGAEPSAPYSHYDVINSEPPEPITGPPAETFVVRDLRKDIQPICKCMSPSVAIGSVSFLLTCTVALIIVLGILAPMRLKEGTTYGDYAVTECSVYHVRKHTFPGKMQCGRLQTLAWYDYPCWDVTVEYKMANGERGILVLRKDATDIEEQLCAIKPSCSYLQKNSHGEIDAFIKSYGQEASSFPCYRHRRKSYAIVDKPPGLKNLEVTLLLLFTPAALLLCIIGVVLICRSGGGATKLCQNWKIEMQHDVEVSATPVELDQSPSAPQDQQ